jgi:hypothetical protein
MKKHRIVQHSYLTMDATFVANCYMVQAQKSFLGIKYWSTYTDFSGNREFEKYDDAMKFLEKVYTQNPGTTKKTVVFETK